MPLATEPSDGPLGGSYVLSDGYIQWKAVLRSVTASTSTERLFRGREGRISVTLALGWFAFLLGRETLPPLLPAIIADFAITEAEAGFVLSVMWGVYALSQFPGGRLSDRLTRKTVLVPSLLIAIVGFVVLAAISSLVGLVVAVSLLGLGGGAYFSSTRGLLTDKFDARRAEAFGIQVAAGSMGSALASGLAVLALALGAWQFALVPAIVLLSAVTLGIHLESRESYVVAPVQLGLRGAVERILRQPRIRRVLVVYSLYAFVWQGLMTFLPTFLQAEKSLSPALAGAAFASLYVTGMMVGPVSGTAGDRYGYLRVSAGSILLAILGIVGLLSVSTTPFLFASVLVLAIGVRSFPAVMQAFVLDLFPDGSLAGDFGALKGMYTGVGSLGPVYFGVVASSLGYAEALIGYVLVLGLAVGGVASLARLSG